MYVVVPVGYPLVLTDFNETEFFQQIFKKY